MLPFQKILCPTDFSDSSYEALMAASEMAVHFNAELCLLHVVPKVPTMPSEQTPPGTFNVSSYQQELEVSSKRALQEVLHKFETKELRSRLIVTQGDPALQIIKIAEEEKPDLIVLATHGRTGWQRAVFGSVAERVVQLARYPVLTIRHHHGGEAEAGQFDSTRRESFDEQAGSKKGTYQEKLEAQVNEWTAKIEALRAKSEKARVEVQNLYREQMETLRIKQEEARQKLQELKGSGGGAMEELKVGVEKALEELKEAFHRARSRLKEKGPPPADTDVNGNDEKPGP